ESQRLAFQCPFVQARPSDPTISGGFKHVFAAVSKGFPSHPAYARHFPKAREKRLFATPSEMMESQKVHHMDGFEKRPQARSANPVCEAY
ncbi:MAG: hypothetical protein AB1547_14265, partial [Thermodesulfobacteriota bacterium]